MIVRTTRTLAAPECTRGNRVVAYRRLPEARLASCIRCLPCARHARRGRSRRPRRDRPLARAGRRSAQRVDGGARPARGGRPARSRGALRVHARGLPAPPRRARAGRRLDGPGSSASSRRRPRAPSTATRSTWRSRRSWPSTSTPAVTLAQRMQDLGRRFDDDTLVALGTYFEGRARVKQGRVAEGLALLDEAMLAALSDRLKPMWTGAIYCGLLDVCHELVDHRRAREWTDATRRWCDPLPVRVALSRYLSGAPHRTCSTYTARGTRPRRKRSPRAVTWPVSTSSSWPTATTRQARSAADAVISPPLKRLHRAHEMGRDPPPGLALLRLAQGHADTAGS